MTDQGKDRGAMAGFGPMGVVGNEQFGDADDELGVEKVCYLERAE